MLTNVKKCFLVTLKGNIWVMWGKFGLRVRENRETNGKEDGCDMGTDFL